MRLAAVASATILLAACDDPFGLKASLAVQFDTLSVYAMSGTPVTYPAAYNAGSGVVLRIAPEAAYDVAFDLQTDGKIRLVPARLVSAARNVGGIPTAAPRVGMQIVSSAFDALNSAPKGSYKYDSTVVVTTGQAVAIEVASDACTYSLSQQIYAKLVVDSVRAATRQLYFRATRDPNCGFRSFQSGVPKN